MPRMKHGRRVQAVVEQTTSQQSAASVRLLCDQGMDKVAETETSDGSGRRGGTGDKGRI